MIDFNTVALVTGANGGLGTSLIDALLSRSVKVYASVRNTNAADVLQARYGNRVKILQFDITDEQSLDSVVSKTTDINLLINNAGVFSLGKILDVDNAQIRQDLNVNLFGTLNVLKAFMPILINNKPSRIVNILSISALANVPNASSYSISKAAAQSLTQAIRPELRPHQVSVHGVYPGPIETAMTAGMNIPKARASDVAESIIESLDKNIEDIFPDDMSRQGEKVWKSNPKILENQLAYT
nr:SDR family NAD(P)-dependent oxidoreductase [uncultured Methylophaga sp.]